MKKLKILSLMLIAATSICAAEIATPESTVDSQCCNSIPDSLKIILDISTAVEEGAIENIKHLIESAVDFNVGKEEADRIDVLGEAQFALARVFAWHSDQVGYLAQLLSTIDFSEYLSDHVIESNYDKLSAIINGSFQADWNMTLSKIMGHNFFHALALSLNHSKGTTDKDFTNKDLLEDLVMFFDSAYGDESKMSMKGYALNINALSAEGKTPLDLAFEYELYTYAAWLMERGAVMTTCQPLN